MQKISRRQLAHMIVSSPEKGRKTLLKQVAAHLVLTKRTKEVSLLVKDIESAAMHSHDHVAAHVTTARKLDARLQTKIERQIKELTGKKNIELIEEIDTSLLGGTIIATPEMEVDLSLAGKLRRLKEIEI